MKEQNIQIYSTNSDLKAVFVERFNRTLLDLIEEPRHFDGKTCWLNHLDAALEKYNNRVLGTTKMTLEMSTYKKIKPNKNNSNDNKKHPKLQVGDFARVPDKRNIFSKSCTQIGTKNFSKHIKLTKVIPSYMV